MPAQPGMSDITEDEIICRLAMPGESGWYEDVRYQSFFPEPSWPAAVLIPFLRPEGSGSPWHVLLTRRTDLVAHHKSQVAFPGGRADPEDHNPTQTALREAHEEIGLQPDQVRILGSLEPLHTISNYRVVPVIGVIPWPYPFRLESQEVSRIFSIPLTWLANPTHFEERVRQITFPGLTQPKEIKVIYYQAYEDEVLWGVSAEIILRLIKRLGLLA